MRNQIEYMRYVQYIWFTDHDIRMGRKQYAVDGLDFENSDLLVKEAEGRSHGFHITEHGGSVLLSKENAFQGTQCLQMNVASEGAAWQSAEVTFWSSGKRHSASLLAGVVLGIALRAKCTDWVNARVMVDIRLSQRPPEHMPAHVIYVAGNREGMDSRPHTLVIPLDGIEMWKQLKCNLSRVVLTEEAAGCSIGGLDNAFDTIMIRVESRYGASVTAWADDFSIRVEKTARETFEMQKAVAKEKGKIYGVTPFIGMEISEAGPHKNCFSGKVPLIPYEELNYEVSHEQGCEWVKKHGGIFAYNHPFERFKKMNISTLDMEEETDKMAEEFIQHASWGASLLEVGFPEGRYFPLKYHLKLWDTLGTHGLFLTGYGSSDNHSNQSGWYEGNNFATWLGVDTQKERPQEIDFIRAMKCGNAYTGNPKLISGDVILETEQGATFGQVVRTRSGSSIAVRFYCDQAKAGWRQKWIVNGDTMKENVISSDAFEDYYCVKASQPLGLVRVEVYDENGKCILLTNPIYINCVDLSEIKIPIERMVKD